MSEYIRTNKFDTNECPNIFVKEKLIRTNVRIYTRDQYIRIFEYSNIFVTLWSDWNDRNSTLFGQIKLMAASEMVNNDLLLLVCFKMHHFGVKSDGWMCWLNLLILPFLWWNFQAKTITHTLESKHCKYVEVKTCEARQWKHIQF